MPTYSATVSSKGQIVIPAAMRAHLNIKAGMRIIFREDQDEIRLIPVGKQRIAKMMGMFKRKPGESSILDDLMEEHRQEQRREDGDWKP